MIDFHVHSTASDGTLAPEAIAARGRAFAALALTDHDGTAGLDAFFAAAQALSEKAVPAPLRLAGIELSVTPGEGYRTFHLLGLGFDPAHPALKDLLKEIRAARERRNRRMCARFAEIGIAIPQAELTHYAAGAIVARPHFAAWLVDHGFAPDIPAAFARFLMRTSPAATNGYVARERVDPARAIAVIHAARGVAVMAHPKFWTDDPVRLRTGLRALKEQGLDGLEAVYQANAPFETVEHLRVARELDLVVTAGSDFHGANKPGVTLGMTVDDERAFLEPLLKALARRGALG